MNRRALLRNGAAILAATAMAGCQKGIEGCAVPLAPPPMQPDLAVSLRAIEADIVDCATAGHCISSAQDFYGLSRIDAVIVDPENRDVILAGIARKDWPALRVPDLVVALQNLDNRYAKRSGDTILYAPPSVSIDPTPETMRALRALTLRMDRSTDAADPALAREWAKTCSAPQNVTIEGVPRDSHFAVVLVAADYDMKRVAHGLERVNPNFPSVAELHERRSRTEARSDAASKQGGLILNRFWFEAGTYHYLEGDETVLIDRAEIILQDEHEFLKENGMRVGAGSTDPDAVEFACSFTSNFPKIAAEKTVYRELANMFQHAAIAKILTNARAWEVAGYRPTMLLDATPGSEVTAPTKLPGIALIKGYDNSKAGANDGVVYQSLACGGVKVDFGAGKLVGGKDSSGSVSALHRRVLASRPGTRAPYWRVAAA